MIFRYTSNNSVFKFFFITTMMAVFFDFKARKLNVEEEGGGLYLHTPSAVACDF